MLVLVHIVNKDKINIFKCKNIKKIKNKIVEISANSKSWNLPKFQSRNLSKSKKLIKV